MTRKQTLKFQLIKIMYVTLNIFEQDEDWKLSSDPGHDIKPDLIKTKGEGVTAQVSLADCLACSGCVTSAETVLI